MDSETPYILVQVSAGSGEQARHIARSIIQERLAACAQIFPIQSCYEWQGSINEDDEYLILMKTRADAYDKLAARVNEIHPYEVPEILALPIIAGLPEYLRWMDGIVAQ